jgi:hypothetical protein
LHLHSSMFLGDAPQLLKLWPASPDHANRAVGARPYGLSQGEALNFSQAHMDDGILTEIPAIHFPIQYNGDS